MDYDSVLLIGAIAMGLFSLFALVLLVAALVYLGQHIVDWLRSGRWRRDLWR